VINLDSEELAWSAGFFDGEGYTKNHSCKSGVPQMDVAQVDRSSLERLQRAVLGFGKIYGPYKYGTNRQPHFKWVVSKYSEVILVVGLIWNWLGDPKKKQIKAAFLRHVPGKLGRPRCTVR
jgi:hypothetical protein